MAKNNTLIFMVLGVAALILIATQGKWFNKEISQTASITTTYYDANGNEIPQYKEPSLKCVLKPCPIGGFGIITNTYQVNIPADDIVYIYHPSGSYSWSRQTQNPIGGSNQNEALIYWGRQRLNTTIPSGAKIISNIIYFYITNPSSIQIAASHPNMHYPTIPEFWTSLSSVTSTWWSEIKNTLIVTLGAPSNLVSLNPIGYPFSTSTDYSIGLFKNAITSSSSATVSGIGSSNIPYVSVTYSIDTCIPETCTSLGKTCGNWSDTCSATLVCGTAPSGYVCNSTGQLVSATYAKYQINVANNGNIPYKNVQIQNTTPSNFRSYFPSNIFQLNQGQQNNWTSSQIDITAYKGQTFTAYIKALNTYTGNNETFITSIAIPN